MTAEEITSLKDKLQAEISEAEQKLTEAKDYFNKVKKSNNAIISALNK